LNLENELNGASESGQQRLAVSFFLRFKQKIDLRRHF
jgi:hypothetical protein